ncbi:MAG: cell division protein SepF [Cyanobacteria bacterium]|nr:cell division protein SepF [Cyanobacteriota bacterium]
MANGPSDGWHGVLVLSPEHFDEAIEAVMAVREQHTVVLNLHRMPPDVAQRAADFVCGGVHALDGHHQRIGDTVFVLTPASVNLNRINATDRTQD